MSLLLLFKGGGIPPVPTASAEFEDPNTCIDDWTEPRDKYTVTMKLTDLIPAKVAGKSNNWLE